MTEPDQINGRLIVTIRRWDDALISALKERYGDRVAVRIEDGVAETAGRNSDSPPFWGGAKWTSPTKTCSTGFSWTANGSDAMLTAAHCISSGGNVSYPNFSNAGTVANASEENWNDGTGTVFYTGQSAYRGDVALIRYAGTKTSAPRIYNGGPGTSTSTGVARMATRRRAFGDPVCTSGITTGVWCGAVTGTAMNIQYIGDPGGPWIRNAARAEAIGWTCPTHGDSGGPVYVNRDDGNVDAAGIFSGSLPLGISCVTYFTDIWEPFTALPGAIKHV
jgi:hypothetical protein